MAMKRSEARALAQKYVEEKRFSHTDNKDGWSTRYAKDGRSMVQIGYAVINPSAGKGRIQDALRRQKKRVKHLPLIAKDSEEIGNKYTRCTWGMCDESGDLWPDPDDHIWPDHFVNDGRIAPRSHGPCPMDVRQNEAMEKGTELGGSGGCFYHCRIFQRNYKTPNRDEAIRLYSKMIEYRELAEGKLTKDDDGEDKWDRDYDLLSLKTDEILKENNKVEE